MPGKGSRARYKAMLEDVTRRVLFAISSNNHSNPYTVEDKRHDRFKRELYRTLAIHRDFDDTCEIYGCDPSTWVKRRHQDPGPVRPLTDLR